MKIAVLIKYVPEATAAWRFAGDHALDRDSVDGRLSELDEYAVEQALRLAEAGAATEIGYLTMGPPRAVDAVRKALAMGGDRAVHVLDDALHGTDAAGTSLVLAAALRRMEADLVVCGMASTDAEMAVLPAMVAERLGIPAVVNAAALRVEDSTVVAERDTDDATEEVVAPLPALVSVTDRSGEARYPSFKGIVAAKKKPVTTWTLADLGIEPGRVGSAGAATQVLAVRPSPPREAGTVITDEGDAAARLADFLAANKLL
ncbi:electron transfer flavoprotein subunit beta/FixA family protein [Nucisporomicrobium flavum]|uniref:electron transfer flavoprotein subunit beta/FixA family protein n=1 Tax=Nucisporomicrobium flavum TaxID=2785915 RepID=UPI003C2D7AEC